MSIKKTPIIELEHVSFAYDETKVLTHISGVIKQGDYVGIIGPNGSGKTSLLKLMLGLLRPTEGKIRMFGKDIAHNHDRSRIGYVPQHISAMNFHFPATVEEVLLTGITKRHGLLNLRQQSDNKAVEKALEIVDIAPLKHRLIAHLSGGQRQRVFIAQALVSQPSVLILDEPTTGIDVNSQERFYKLLDELNKKMGLTIILVSHDVDIVTSEINSVLCINRELVFHGTPQDFVKGPYLEKLYGRRMKLVAHEHAH